MTYAVSGTAQGGTDYTALSGVVTIPDGSASASVAVTALSGARNNAVVTLQASANANYTVGTQTQGSVTISNAAPGSFAAYQQQYFGNQANGSDAAPTADFDHDGLSNLLEYALGTNPATAQTAPAYTVSVPAANQLRLSFRRSLNTGGNLTLRVTASDTLADGTWTTLATKTGAAAWTVATGVVVTDDAGTGAVTVTDAPATGTRPRRFLRLSADLTGN